MSIIPSGSSITCKGLASVTLTSWSGYLTDQESLANLGRGLPSTGGVINSSLSSLFMPYGYDGEPVIGGYSYTVPEGKVLVTSNYHGYITVGGNSVNSFSRDSSSANDVVILSGNTAFSLIYNGSTAGNGFVGMLFEENEDFEPVHGGDSYTVPTGKKLYLTSAVGIMRINGNAVSFRPTIGKNHLYSLVKPHLLWTPDPRK